MVFPRKAFGPKLQTEKTGPSRAARGLWLTAIAYTIAAISVIALWIGSRRNIDRGYFANAQAATIDEARPVEARGTSGTADTHAVVDFKSLARNHTRSVIAVRRGAVRPRSKPRSAAIGPEVAIPPIGTTLSELSAQSPAVSASFIALGDDNTTIPPDTQGTVGPKHLMTTLNSQVRIQNKDGTVVSTLSMNVFWSSMGVVPNSVGTRDGDLTPGC